jgi:hypothetical protein
MAVKDIVMARFWILTTIMFLAACGGSGSDSDGGGIDPRLARLDVYEAQKLRVLGDPGAGVMGMAPTPQTAVPDMGAAVFTGSATVRVENPDTPLVLFGDSSITIGFADAAVSGTLDGFFGTNSTGDVVDYDGGITIDGGSLDDGISLDYAGALSAAGENLVFEGVMDGEFLGDPVSAISAADLQAGVIYNGGPVNATLVVIGETTDVP